ncbi:MAG: 4Fe-4S binding protein [Treponema sp.]|nr:4Fe-4S binding protein [Treponema sp.]
MKKLLMGNEAIALGALRAGVSVVTGYPGTPSTEILETIAREKKGALSGLSPAARGDVHVEWSVNEKSALEVAAGAAIAGGRALVTMKQVGLNVASDPLMSLNYVGVKGGLVIVVADDPGPISSQTEQDTRRFGTYAKIMVFDPVNPEEAYLMAAHAFDYSERYGRPVILRPTTRVCHSYASVELLPDLKREIPAGFDKGGGRWVIFPGLAYRSHLQIEKDLLELGDVFSSYPGNRITVLHPASPQGLRLGIAAGGVSRAYVKEALAAIGGKGRGETSYTLLEVATVPFPSALGRDFLEGSGEGPLGEVLVVEELDPVIEDALIRLCGIFNLSVKIRGKLSGDMPKAGENTPAQVSAAVSAFLGIPAEEGKGKAEAAPPELPVRPPVLCAGCPHRGSFFAVKEAVNRYNRDRRRAGLPPRKAVFSGDIGCYTLGNAQPLDMVDTCLCMGAGITMAQGLNRVEPETLNFAFAGDSTFFHTGIPGIVNGVYNNADTIVTILDNFTTAMTGSQPHPGTGKTAAGSPAEKIGIPGVLRALGVKEIARADPFDINAAEEAVLNLLDKRGLRALVFEGPCIVLGAARGGGREVNRETCTGCGICVSKLGCPAIFLSAGYPRAGKSAQTGVAERKAFIDADLCTGCGICKTVCPAGAIGNIPPVAPLPAASPAGEKEAL